MGDMDRLLRDCKWSRKTVRPGSAKDSDLLRLPGPVRRAAHLEIGLGQRVARRINNEVPALGAHGIAEICRIPAHSGTPGNEGVDRQANAAREGLGGTVREQAFISAANRAKRIPEQRAAAKTE
jgi:hypothetical protein